MKMPPFEMERMQSTWENVVDYDMSESGIRAVSIRELVELGFDLEGVMDMPLGYSQSNGTIALREGLARLYPGSGIDNIQVTNGTSEANYLLSLALLDKGDAAAIQLPNYMQLNGIPPSLGAEVKSFRLDFSRDWDIDWEGFEKAVSPGTQLVYISNPNNPTGKVLSKTDMERIVERCERVGAWLLADEVYIGAEIEGAQTPSFWGMSERVIVTSGLSKAFGIPGIRIGWMVGPKSIVDECWAQHDYLTIGPNTLSDIMARTAVDLKNRASLYARTRRILKKNLPFMETWISGFRGFLEFRKPQAGAFCFVRYDSEAPSLEICERIRKKRSTLIVPGSHLGLEGFLRIWMGGERGYLEEGLSRIASELNKLS